MCLSNCHKIKNHDEITCYKVVKNKGIFFNRYFSVYENFRYKIGELYEEPMKLKYYWNHLNKIEDGFFHTFKNYDDAVKYFEQMSHFFRYGLKIIECVIPSDAYVYEGEYTVFSYPYEVLSFKSYASTKIFPKKILKIKK